MSFQDHKFIVVMMSLLLFIITQSLLIRNRNLIRLKLWVIFIIISTIINTAVMFKITASILIINCYE